MRASVVSLLLALTVPSIAHAGGVRHFNNYCTAGAFRSCASVSIAVVDLPGGFTRLQITIQNRQGSINADNGGASIFTGLNIQWPSEPDYPGNLIEDDNPTISTGGTNIIGGPDLFWDRSLAYNFLFLNLSSVNSGIGGCDTPAFGPSVPGREEIAGVWQTCAAFGAPGSVVFTFTTAEFTNWDVDNMSLNWGMLNEHGGASCVPGQNCFATTVPEPVTLTLVATGLVGVGLARRRRRARLSPAHRSGYPSVDRKLHIR